ncbi:MAG: alpha-amylase, partial [Dehalococcoidia bacterium]
LIDLRQREMALQVGSYLPIPAQGDILAYEREYKGDRFIVALNFGSEPQTLGVPGVSGVIEVSTHMDLNGESVSGAIELRADEGVVVRVG